MFTLFFLFFFASYNSGLLPTRVLMFKAFENLTIQQISVLSYCRVGRLPHSPHILAAYAVSHNGLHNGRWQQQPICVGNSKTIRLQKPGAGKWSAGRCDASCPDRIECRGIGSSSSSNRIACSFLDERFSWMPERHVGGSDARVQPPNDSDQAIGKAQLYSLFQSCTRCKPGEEWSNERTRV